MNILFTPFCFSCGKVLEYVFEEGDVPAGQCAGISIEMSIHTEHDCNADDCPVPEEEEYSNEMAQAHEAQALLSHFIDSYASIDKGLADQPSSWRAEVLKMFQEQLPVAVKNFEEHNLRPPFVMGE